MPGPAEILTGLTRIANEAFGLAIVWHALVASFALAFWMGFRPSQRATAMALSAPLASVALVAWVFENSFNAVVFALGALALAFLASRTAAKPLALGERWSVGLGGGLMAFGWLYPHFLVGHWPGAYLYGAPLGVVPCPTLSLVVGATLLAGGLVGGLWRMVLTLLATFYGVFGILRLGVWIDFALLLGAAGLTVQHWQTTHRGATAAL